MFVDVVCEDCGVKHQLLETLSVGEKLDWNSSAGGSPCTAWLMTSVVVFYSVGYTASL